MCYYKVTNSLLYNFDSVIEVVWIENVYMHNCGIQ